MKRGAPAQQLPWVTRNEEPTDRRKCDRAAQRHQEAFARVVAPLRGAPACPLIRGFLPDSSPTAIVVLALRATTAALQGQSPDSNSITSPSRSVHTFGARFNSSPKRRCADRGRRKEGRFDSALWQRPLRAAASPDRGNANGSSNSADPQCCPRLRLDAARSDRIERALSKRPSLFSRHACLDPQ